MPQTVLKVDSHAGMRAKGDTSGALEIVEQGWNTLLHELIEIFEETRIMLVIVGEAAKILIDFETIADGVAGGSRELA